MIYRTLALRVLNAGLTAVVGVFLARVLHADGRGAYAALVAVATLSATVGHLSIDQAQVVLWSRPHTRAALAANSVLLGPLLGMAAALVMAVVTTVTGVGGWMGLIAVPLIVTGRYLDRVLVLRGRADTVEWGSFFGAGAQCTLIVVASVMGRLSAGTAIVIWLVSLCVTLMMFCRTAKPRIADCDLRLGGECVRLGVSYHSGLLATLLFSRVEILMLSALASAEAAGLYAVAIGMADLIRVPVYAVGQVALSGQASGDLTHAARVTRHATLRSVMVTLAACGVLCVAAPIMVPLVYGPAFDGVVPVLFALMPGLFAANATWVVWAYLLRLERPGIAGAIGLLALLLDVVLAAALVPVWGVFGCALASSVSSVALAVAHIAWFRRHTRSEARRVPQEDPGMAPLR